MVNQTLTLSEGWNFIATPNDGTIVDPLNIITVIYKENRMSPNETSQHEEITNAEVQQNKGYWIKCNADGDIEITVHEH